MTNLKKSPRPQNSLIEAKNISGYGRKDKLPECPSNSNPSTTAEHQNEYFVSEIADLPSKADLKSQTDTVHEEDT